MTMARTDRTGLEEGRANHRVAATSIELPSWVEPALAEAAGGAPRQRVETLDGIRVRTRDAGRLALCSAVVEGASELSLACFRDRVTRAYLLLFRAAAHLQARHRVRMWSFIPNIGTPRGDGLSTYHVFNVGRFEAFAREAGDEGDMSAGLPTATGTGHAGPDLVVHCLTSEEAGLNLENPRQVPAYRYSARYGPRPPCFARGTIMRRGGASTLLIGGTASIRDEDSMHAGDLESQFVETFENVSALIREAAAWHRGPAVLRHIRAYCPRGEFEPVVLERVRRRVGPGPQIELVSAELCREELLVEIEGVVEMGIPG